MAGKRQKKRTHVKVSNVPTPNKKIPKSFVVKCGGCESSVGQLVKDFRRVMEPNTASRLKERKTNKLKDFAAVAGPLGVSHFVLFSQTEENLNLRFAVFPNGPTLYYRIDSYCLMKDLSAAQLQPHSPGMEYQTSPLVVLSNFDMEDPVQKLQCTILQNAFPTVSPSQIKLSDIRRVVLFHKEGEITQMRHYLIIVKEGGLKNKVDKKLIKAQHINLGKYTDIADYFMQGGETSGSEVDDPSNKVTLAQKYHGKGNEKNNQRSIKLWEMGPRINLQLIKVTEGLNGGKVLHHI